MKTTSTLMQQKQYPLIGLTTYAADAQGRYTLPHEYELAVTRAGGLAVLLPTVENLIPQILERLDGLVLTGGGDISPALYGGNAAHPELYGQSEVRDRYDLALIHAALPRQIPLLAICRGMQMLNIAYGGNLHVHLPEVFGETIAHRSHIPGPLQHPVTIRPKSRLSDIVGLDPMEIVSWHHQAIDRVGEGLQIAATAPDGLIEALEIPEHCWCIAVQWHPELVSKGYLRQETLWRDFMGAARKYHTTSSKMA
ncbi:gamma-glutamyl-gamma-aminobutyrate hydrolase family protein [Acidithiobacillus ferridurans]|uniref:gamma-glutamyl-gamma-aminobutyrate hydrolase family protein n=1 Tax=Acidithiobacillus ferridurans TaxID=1232575 RepID=UPI001C07EEA6|nr:gamma-glutamyl-gamma-aminobutyrate hydrolase family protein [Acidithiobacillus ferridurans]MBU2732942.1 gamma-glutamyl-gamma-aminobutyrate hydrolase family protein [Acidithiobacillus ferridurans]